MKSQLAMLTIAVVVASPPVAAQIFSWDPLKDVENALPEGCRTKGGSSRRDSKFGKWRRMPWLRSMRWRPERAA